MRTTWDDSKFSSFVRKICYTAELYTSLLPSRINSGIRARATRPRELVRGTRAYKPLCMGMLCHALSLSGLVR